MSTVKTNNVQIGQSVTATNNFTWYQPATPDGTVRLGVGNAGATTLDAVTVNNSGNVGIGTSSPVANHQLTIKAPTSNYAQIALVGGDTSSQWDVSAYNDGSQFFIGYANSPKLRLDSSGNLGLGVTPSAWGSGFKSLDMLTTGAFGATSGGAYTFYNTYFDSSSTPRYKTSQTAAYYGVEYNRHVWNIAPSGTAGNAISFTQAMTLDASGRLIVGNTSQLYGFSGRLYTEASSSSYLPLVALSSYSGDLSNPAGSFYKYDNNSTTSQVFVRFAINNGAAGCGQINGNGAAAAAFGSFSDSRLKENITALPSQLANICALKPSEFDYKDGSGHQIGFIAQEMQEVYPDVVGEGEDGMLTITGWSKTEARIVKAIQELSAELNELKQKVNA